jgi:glycosyltransferase involved in cell wall biosynthesis
MGPYLADRGGGVSVYVRNISERLARKHDVTVFATNPGGLPRFEVVNGVKVERFRRFAPSGAYFFSLEMLLKLRHSEFDVVHGHCYQAFPLHFSTLAKRKRFFVSMHLGGLGVSKFRDSVMKLLKPFGRRTLTQADRIIASSEYERNFLLEHFNLNPKKIVMIPCGVNLSEFKALSKCKSDVKRILYVGRLSSYKGAHYLVEALPKLNDNIILEIVGKGPVRKSLEERAKNLKVLERVRFYENLPREELAQRYADADVFVLPSQHESYAIVVAEALVSGTPCIVSRTSALNEWIDNETCFGVDYPIRISELVKVISSVLDSGIRGEAVFNRWLGGKILDWDDVVLNLEKLYEE